MKLRLTDGSDWALQSCTEELEAESGTNVLICELSQGYNYNFDDVSETLKKEEIAEILTVYDEDNKVVFQTKEYQEVAAVINNVFTNIITIKFKAKIT